MGDALHTHGGVTDAREARLAQASLLAVQGPSILDARTGVIAGPGSRSLVTGTTATAPMAVAVAPHEWVTSRGAANGPYLGVLEAIATVPIAAAPASGSRIDVVYVKQQDATPGIPSPDATTAPQYAAVTGTVGQGKPAIPVGAEELATVQVAAGATATNGAGVTITNTARQTGARGQVFAVANEAERLSLANYVGLQVIEIDTGRRYFSGSASWAYTGGGTPPVFPAAFAAAPSGTNTTGWQPMNGFGVYLDGGGVKHLTGWVQNTATFTPVGNETIATIRAAADTGGINHRPLASRFFPVAVSAGQAVVQVDVDTAGLIRIPRPSTVSIPALSVWGMDVISYL